MGQEKVRDEHEGGELKDLHLVGQGVGSWENHDWDVHYYVDCTKLHSMLLRTTMQFSYS
jgi:hypothetical protein